jgi:hypothetical protein
MQNSYCSHWNFDSVLFNLSNFKYMTGIQISHKILFLDFSVYFFWMKTSILISFMVHSALTILVSHLFFLVSICYRCRIFHITFHLSLQNHILGIIIDEHYFIPYFSSITVRRSHSTFPQKRVVPLSHSEQCDVVARWKLGCYL